MKRILYIFFAFSSTVSLLTSCVGEPEFNVVPAITFKNLNRFRVESEGLLGKSIRDSVVISIDFQDGDGDLGVILPQGKTPSADDVNFEFKPFYKYRGVFKEISAPDAFTKLYLNFLLKPDQRRGPIEGTLDYSINFEHALFGFSAAGGEMKLLPENIFVRKRAYKQDTLLFEITIKDRAKNRSNTIRTSEVVINQ